MGGKRGCAENDVAVVGIRVFDVDALTADSRLDFVARDTGCGPHISELHPTPSFTCNNVKIDIIFSYMHSYTRIFFCSD